MWYFTKNKKRSKKRKRVDDDDADMPIEFTNRPNLEDLDEEEVSPKRPRRNKPSTAAAQQDSNGDEEAYFDETLFPKKDDLRMYRKYRKRFEEVYVEEEITPFDPNNLPPLHQFIPYQTPSAHELAAIKKYGIPYKVGTYSPRERRIIARNFESYCAETGMDYAQVYGIEHGREQKKIMMKTHFYLRIAHGLPHRHPYWVFSYARHLLHEGRTGHLGAVRFTKENDELLLKLREQKVKDTVMGSQLHRPATTCKRRLRTIDMKLACSERLSTIERCLHVLMLVSRIHHIPNLLVARTLSWKHINWNEVNKRIPERDRMNCSTKAIWRYVINPTPIEPHSAEIYFMFELVAVNYRDDRQTDWDQLAVDIGLSDGYLAKHYFISYRRDVLSAYSIHTVELMSEKDWALLMMTHLKKKVNRKLLPWERDPLSY